MIKEFRILSIDGGGIRGILPAVFLSSLQQEIGNTSIHNYFDLIVGTSTGGIIALALALEIPPTEIAALYGSKGKTIFQRRSRLALLRSKYDNRPLVKELKAVYGQETLLGAAKCRVCIPSVDIVTGRIKVFKTSHHSEFTQDHKRTVWSIATATAAAPIFFPPFDDPQHGVYADGGLWANNPTLVGVTEAVRLGYPLSCLKVLSIGTGSQLFHKSKSRQSGSGILGWGTSVIELAFQAQSQGVHNIVPMLGVGSYMRVDWNLPAKVAGLDVVEFIPDLQHLAKEEAQCRLSEVKNRFLNSTVASYKQCQPQS